MKIIWRGKEKLLPGIGYAKTGSEITSDDEETLNSYVEQGLADVPSSIGDNVITGIIEAITSDKGEI